MILNEFFNLPQVFEKDMEEGIFGSKPSPVLPIVAKIDRVARQLTPQNVETGKQIIQSHTRDITRILSPQDKAGVDVIEQGMAEGNLTELSPDTLASYKKKAGADASAADKRGDIERGNKRFSGIVKATIKQGEQDAKQQQPKAPVRESRLALLKQIIQS